jgi:chorismate mutase-like protein
MTLEDLRQQIDDIDAQLVLLLNQRAECALAISRAKRAREMPVYQPEREAQVLRRVRAASAARGGPLGEEAITRLFERIIDEARALESKAAK